MKSEKDFFLKMLAHSMKYNRMIPIFGVSFFSFKMNKLSEKYAQILGHQNNKQKIRHIQKLKEENIMLKNVRIVIRLQISFASTLKFKLVKRGLFQKKSVEDIYFQKLYHPKIPSKLSPPFLEFSIVFFLSSLGIPSKYSPTPGIF